MDLCKLFSKVIFKNEIIGIIKLKRYILFIYLLFKSRCILQHRSQNLSCILNLKVKFNIKRIC